MVDGRQAVPAATIVLASGSPRRRDLLQLLRVPFRVEVPDVDETPRPAEPPDAYVRRLADAKASAARAAPAEVVLAADTTVVLDGEIVGKPEDDADAASILRRLSGRAHEVVTGLAVWGRGRRTVVVTTTVRFAELTPGEIDWYVRTGEPAGKAGAYAIQGAGGAFVEAVDGSSSNVVGLPLHMVRRLLADEGVHLTTG